MLRSTTSIAPACRERRRCAHVRGKNHEGGARHTRVRGHGRCHGRCLLEAAASTWCRRLGFARVGTCQPGALAGVQPPPPAATTTLLVLLLGEGGPACTCISPYPRPRRPPPKHTKNTPTAPHPLPYASAAPHTCAWPVLVHPQLLGHLRVSLGGGLGAGLHATTRAGGGGREGQAEGQAEGQGS